MGRFTQWLLRALAPQAFDAVYSDAVKRTERPNSAPAGVFSTDLPGSRRVVPSLAALQQRLFPRTCADIRVTDATGAAMDSDDWNTPSFKEVWKLQTAGVSEALYGWYVSQSFIGYQLCAVLSQHWLIDKACTVPARDATRVGYTISADGETKLSPQAVNRLKQLDKKFKLRANGREFVRNCRIFGIRIALFEVQSTDPEYYEKPFNPDGITPKSYRGISQVDPYWITPELDADAAANPASAHFYEPTYWRINGKRYHRSHLIVIKGPEVPDVLKPTYYYGGVPLTQRIYERVYAAERTANEAPQLAMTKRLTVLSGINMEAVAGNQGAFEEKMQTWTAWRDNFGIKACGGDEKIEQFDTTLNDLDETITTQYALVCAIAGAPITKLLGTPPKGMDATGEHDESNYHEELESILEHDVRPLYERHHLLCMRSYVEPELLNGVHVALTLEFDKLDAETSKERSDRLFTDSQRDKNYADTGAIDGIDIRERMIADPDSPYAGIEAAIPEGPRPLSVVDPGAEKTAPNAPTPAEQAPPGAGNGAAPTH